MANTTEEIRTVLARAVANRTVSDKAIDEVAMQIAKAKHPIRKLDICTLGICWDYFVDNEDWWSTLPDLVSIPGSQLIGIEIFPFGIPWPDLFQVRVTQRFDAIPELGG